MYIGKSYGNYSGLFGRRPEAIARLMGSEKYPGINGTVWFYTTELGILVVADIEGLPKSEGKCDGRIFGFHIHSGGTCSGNNEDPFADAGSHYDLEQCEHPYHAGDMPSLFGVKGRAFASFLTDRFTVKEIIGRTVVIHASTDDFTSQPAGAAGDRIACGEIKG